jgi:molybdopterin molybdotransferase
VLSVDAARAAVLAHARPLPAEDVPLAAAAGRVLAEPVAALHDVPPFDNSAMDGYAAAAGPAGRALRVAGEARAGAPFAGGVGPGEAVRISTGAAFPAGADGVLPVERAEARDDGTVVLHDALAAGDHVRRAGDDVPAGAVTLRPGTLLGPGEIGVAASGGHATVRCARRPRAVVLTTGDELVAPGRALGPGQIHEANLLTLGALLAADGAELLHAGHMRDDPRAIGAAIAAALDGADLLLLSGGLSVGPHDEVKPALEAQGVHEVFWRVALRPGGPTWCGTHGATLVLGLPGNPVSTMVTYLLFGRPAVRRLQGRDPSPPTRRAVLTQDLERLPRREDLVRVRLEDGRATPTGRQDSNRLTSMLGADGLARVPAGDGRLLAGDEVVVELLDG